MEKAREMSHDPTPRCRAVREESIDQEKVTRPESHASAIYLFMTYYVYAKKCQRWGGGGVQTKKVVRSGLVSSLSHLGRQDADASCPGPHSRENVIRSVAHLSSKPKPFADTGEQTENGRPDRERER